jgi:hypothetical protein
MKKSHRDKSTAFTYEFITKQKIIKYIYKRYSIIF